MLMHRKSCLIPTLFTLFEVTINFLNIRSPKKFVVTTWLYHRVTSPNHADGMANSVDPDQEQSDLGLHCKSKFRIRPVIFWGVHFFRCFTLFAVTLRERDFAQF